MFLASIEKYHSVEKDNATLSSKNVAFVTCASQKGAQATKQIINLETEREGRAWLQ
jgi:hypothetical protein